MNRTTTKWIRLLWAAALVFLGTNTAQAQTSQEIAKKAFESTVLLVMEDAHGQPLSLGSGFFVSANEVATNRHVVKGAARGYAKIIGQKAKYDIEGITAVDSERDLVILKISGARAAALVVGNSESVQVGETVYAVGNPQGLEGTFSQGIVSSIRDIGTDKLLQITAPISPGSSGGPVLNGNGEVVGVSVATFRGGQNLNFAIPSNYLKALLGKIGPVKPLAQAKPSEAERSIFADLGGKSTEGVIGENFTYEDSYSHQCLYTFSLVNKLREPVQHIKYLVVFYDQEGKPLDVTTDQFDGVIPAGLAKRAAGMGSESVCRLSKQVEIRILSFKVAE